jgi:hypothetical protein
MIAPFEKTALKLEQIPDAFGTPPRRQERRRVESRGADGVARPVIAPGGIENSMECTRLS